MLTEKEIKPNEMVKEIYTFSDCLHPLYGTTVRVLPESRRAGYLQWQIGCFWLSCTSPKEPVKPSKGKPGWLFPVLGDSLGIIKRNEAGVSLIAHVGMIYIVEVWFKFKIYY